MSAFKCFALSCGLVGAYTLLSKADGFDLSSAACDYDVGFGWVAGCALGLVVA